MGFLLLWVAGVASAPLVASGRNRSTALLVKMSSALRTLMSGAGSSSVTPVSIKRCSDCGHFILPEARFCRHCDAEQPFYPEPIRGAVISLYSLIPRQRMAGIEALGDLGPGAAAALPEIERCALYDPIPDVRTWASAVFEKVSGRPLGYRGR